MFIKRESYYCTLCCTCLFIKYNVKTTKRFRHDQRDGCGRHWKCSLESYWRCSIALKDELTNVPRVAKNETKKKLTTVLTEFEQCFQGIENWLAVLEVIDSEPVQRKMDTIRSEARESIFIANDTERSHMAGSHSNCSTHKIIATTVCCFVAEYYNHLTASFPGQPG